MFGKKLRPDPGLCAVPVNSGGPNPVRGDLSIESATQKFLFFCGAADETNRHAQVRDRRATENKWKGRVAIDRTLLRGLGTMLESYNLVGKFSTSGDQGSDPSGIGLILRARTASLSRTVGRIVSEERPFLRCIVAPITYPDTP